MKMSRWNRAASFAAASLLSLSVIVGCGGPAPAKIPSSLVSGKVTLDGKPAVAAQVRFVPTGTTKGFGGTALTNDEGRYMIEESGAPGAEGLPEGSYKVLIEEFRPPEDPELAAQYKMPTGTPSKIPAMYSAEDRSPFDVMIVSGNAPQDFELKTRGR